MKPVREGRCGYWVALVVSAAMALVVAAPAAAAHSATFPARPVTADRWTRSVCRDVSTWLQARGEIETRISETLGALSGDLRAVVAKVRLTRATARGIEASNRLFNDAKAAGTPNVNGGEQLTSAYLKTLRGYSDAYSQARSELARTKTTDKQQFAIAAQQINGTLVPKVATDPVEGLRATPELVAGINGYCSDVATYLAAKIDPSCGAVLDTTRQLVDVDNRVLALPADATERDSLSGDEERVFGQLRNQLAACNVAAVPRACQKLFDSARRLADVDSQFVASPMGSAQEQSLADEEARQFDIVRSDVAAVCR
jgi:hypothetical protein